VRAQVGVEAEAWAAERARFEKEESQMGSSREWYQGRALAMSRNARNFPLRRRTVSQLRQTGSAYLCSASTSLSSRTSRVWPCLSTLYDGTSRSRPRAQRSPSSCSLRSHTMLGQLPHAEQPSRSTHTAGEPRSTSALTFAEGASIPSPSGRLSRLLKRASRATPFRAGSGRTSPSM
jgi:hypothetical protein